MRCGPSSLYLPSVQKQPTPPNSLSQNIMICFHLIEYFQTAGEFKTCISNISISLNFWESLQRNTPFVKYQQPLPYFPSNFPCMYNTWGWGKMGEKGHYPCVTVESLWGSSDYEGRGQSAYPGTTPLDQINHADRQKYEKINNRQKHSTRKHYSRRNPILWIENLYASHVFVALLKQEV